MPRSFGSLQPAGALGIRYLPMHGHYTRGLPEGTPLRYWLRTLWKEAVVRLRVSVRGFMRGLTSGSGVVAVGRLHATHCRADGSVRHLGLIATKLVTDAFVNFLVDDWDGGASDVSLFNYHGCGTGVAAEAATDTALGTESTTILNPDNTRATGTKTQPAANQARTVGTLTFDGAGAITEHGVFTQAATGGGTLWDRSVFAAINVASGDSIQFTYTCTFSSGG